MRESSPEDNRIGNRTELSNVDSTDDEYMFVGTYTSVIGNNIVNTVRLTRTHEFYSGGPPVWYDIGGHTSLDGAMRNVTPSYHMSTFQDGVAPWAWGREDSQWQLQQHDVVVRPRQDGRSRHQVRRHLPPLVYR